MCQFCLHTEGSICDIKEEKKAVDFKSLLLENFTVWSATDLVKILDTPWEVTFTPGVSAAAAELCEWVQIRIYLLYLSL